MKAVRSPETSLQMKHATHCKPHKMTVDRLIDTRCKA